jgi:hypothetical protein
VSGTATLQTCGGQTAIDTVLYVSTDAAGSNQIACNDDTANCPISAATHNASSQGSSVTLTVTAGQTYYVFVDGYGGSNAPWAGAYSLTILPPH